MKTWRQLEDLAARDHFHLHRPIKELGAGVTICEESGAQEPLLSVVRFLSCEPLLEPIQFRPFTVCAGTYCFDCGGPGVKIDEEGCCATCGVDAAWFGVDWVIAGCESGPGARPCEVAWIRSMRDQCAGAGVPLFLKQAREEVDRCGEGCGQIVRYTVTGPDNADASCGCTAEGPEMCSPTGVMFGAGSKRKGGGVIELPYLDGVQHAAFPETRP